MTARSYVDFACATRASIAWLSISSPGLGGSAPATSTSSVRPAEPATVGESRPTICVADHNDSVPINTSDRPGPARTSELLGERRTPQVGFDEQHDRADPGGRARQLTCDSRLPVMGSSRCHQQRAQLTIDVEVAQVRADQVEGLFLAGRQCFVGLLPAKLLSSPRTSKRATLGSDAEQRKTVDRLQILRLPDPPVEALEQQRDAQPEQQTQDLAEDRVP
jgi:hypothetical protein